MRNATRDDYRFFFPLILYFSEYKNDRRLIRDRADFVKTDGKRPPFVNVYARFDLANVCNALPRYELEIEHTNIDLGSPVSFVHERTRCCTAIPSPSLSLLSLAQIASRFYFDRG